MRQRYSWMVHAQLVITTISWGGAFIAGKFATEDLSPAAVAFLRFFFAALVLYPLLWAKEPDRKKPGMKEWLLFLAFGATGMFLYNLCFFAAAKYSTVMKSSLVIAANAPMITLLSAWFLKDRITLRSVLGLAVALAGTLTIITEGRLFDLIHLKFEPIDLVLLGACISWAVHSVLGKVVMRSYSSLAATTYGTGFGALLLLPFALATTSVRQIGSASFGTWVSIGYVALIVSVISFLWWNEGIKQIGPSKSAIYINIMPLSAVVMAALVFGETFSVSHIIGGLLIFGGIFFNLKKPAQTPVGMTKAGAGVGRAE